jgi:DNA polymerase-3 subunit alpha
VKDRLAFELDVIKNMGFSGYFLIVADFVQEAKRRGITVGPGRGSAAGSIVSYVLDITTLDPIEHGLLFERFLNPERVELPDIDIDFADTRRDEVLAYVREKYGADRVIQICTFGTLAARAAVKDVGRAYGISFALRFFPKWPGD